MPKKTNNSTDEMQEKIEKTFQGIFTICKKIILLILEFIRALSIVIYKNMFPIVKKYSKTICKCCKNPKRYLSKDNYQQIKSTIASNKKTQLWVIFIILIICIISTKGCHTSSLSTTTYSTGKGYEAILSCELQGKHINLISCFGNSYTDTSLELQNGDFYRMYKSWELATFGSLRSDGVHFDLKNSFSIKAQNASDSLILTLRIKDKVTGEILFHKSADKYGVISVHN